MEALKKVTNFFSKNMALIVIAVAAVALFSPQTVSFLKTSYVNLHSAAFQLAAQIVMKVSTFSTFCSILKARSYTTKHGEGSRKNSLVLDSMLISVSSTFQAQISGSLRPYTKNCFNSC